MYDNITEFMDEAKQQYKYRGHTEMFAYEHPLHEDKIAAILMIGKEAGVKNLEDFLNVKWNSKIIQDFSFEEEENQQKIKLKLNYNNQNFIVKGRYKKIQNMPNMALINFKTDDLRGKSGSFSESFSQSKSTMAEDFDIDSLPSSMQLLTQIELHYNEEGSLESIVSAMTCKDKFTIKHFLKEKLFESIIKELESFVKQSETASFQQMQLQ